MSALLQTSAALVAGIAAALAVHVLGQREPKLFHRPNRAFTWAVVVASGAVGALAPVAPTGIDGVDVVYRALFAAVFTFAAGRARRQARLIAGAVAAIGSAGAGPWSVIAFVALGLATGSAKIRQPARPFGVIVGALQAQVLLRLAWPDASYATAALAALAFVVVVVSGFRHARSRERRPALFAFAGLAAVGLFIAGLVAVGLFGIQRDLRDGARAADRGLDAARAGETEEAVAQLHRASTRLASADDGLRATWMNPGRVLPVLGRYLDSGQRLTSAARAMVEPALESARLVDGDALRITDARIDLDAVAALRPPLVSTLAAVPEARAAVDELQEEELPGPVARRIRDLDRTLSNATEDGEFLLEVLDTVPQLLGADEPRRWFIVMQTPSEQRASGGIAGGYGELLVDDGRLELVRAGEGGRLNQGGASWELGEMAQQFDRFTGTGPERYFQNVTNVPHFPTVGRTIASVYPQAGGAPVDGVISVDPHVLAALLALTGPVEVPGWPAPITADNAVRTLLYEQYLRLEQDEGGQFITDTIEATFRALETRTLPSPAKVLDALSPMVQSERLKLYSPRTEEQSLFEEMGVAGAMAEVDGDYLRVVTLNNSANKIDWYQQRAISYDVVHDPATGRVDATATIAITNGAPAEGESELLIGGLDAEPGPPGRSRLTIDLYSALQLQAATVDGRPVRMSGDRAFDRNLYWTVQTLAPGQTSVVEVYLTGLLEPGAPYALDLGMQPVVRPDEVAVRVATVDGWEISSARGLDVRDGVATDRFELTQPRRFVVRSAR